jgi:hypothetical protein
MRRASKARAEANARSVCAALRPGCVRPANGQKGNARATAGGGGGAVELRALASFMSTHRAEREASLSRGVATHDARGITQICNGLVRRRRPGYGLGYAQATPRKARRRQSAAGRAMPSAPRMRRLLWAARDERSRPATTAWRRERSPSARPSRPLSETCCGSDVRAARRAVQPGRGLASGPLLDGYHRMAASVRRPLATSLCLRGNVPPWLALLVGHATGYAGPATRAA